MKNIVTLIIIFSYSIIAFSQQERHNTQFYNYKLGYNPAYAGNKESSCLTALYRSQWLGLDGAPETAMLSYNMPFANQNMGAGINLERETIGHFETYTVDLAYAYRLRVGRGHLSLGLQGSLRSQEASFNQARAIEAGDPGFGLQETKLLFNFGAGAYYSAEKFYIGLSAPRLLKNNIDFSESNTVISREVSHIYLMGGLIFDLSENVKLQPQALIKMVNSDDGRAPLDADINFNFIFSEKYFAGLGYRFGGNKRNNTGESANFYLGAELVKGLRFGMSYDFTISDLRDQESGSIEASLIYCFGKSEGAEFENPRFF